MHQFSELVYRCASFTLFTTNKAFEETAEALETSAATPHVKNLQMLQLQKTIVAVGMFSIFEAILQDRLTCENGFEEAARRLQLNGDVTVLDTFTLFHKAINVLKHGRGRSYSELLLRTDELPFKMKTPGQHFFFEGDVSEITTLIQIDDQFILGCADAIRQVTDALMKREPGLFL